MHYKNILIYYFSGTGNSKNVAQWISVIASKYNIDYQIISIASAFQQTIQKPTPESLIIFISPIHGFNYPPIVLKFLARFPKGTNNIVLMNTRAGMLIGKYITPGLSGIAFYLASLILKTKGYSIKGMQAVDMPSNWISVHPGLNDRTVKFLHQKNKERVQAFAEKILNKKSSFKAVREIIQDLAVAPISILYFIAGRFVIAKTYYASKKCNHCNLCITSCPVKAIKQVDNRPYWTFRCESCMHCMSYCPQKAIETSHGFTALLGIIFSFLCTPLLYASLSLLGINVTNEIFKSVIETILFLMLQLFWYRLLHFLLRFSFFEKLMVYTSLTKFKFWGRRYKALND